MTLWQNRTGQEQEAGAWEAEAVRAENSPAEAAARPPKPRKKAKELPVNYTAAQESSMPALTGSEKQVKWAEDIRRNALVYADNAVRETLERVKSNAGTEYDISGLTASALTQARKEFVDAFRQQTSAKQWIDSRVNFGQNGVQNAIVNRAWTIAGYRYDREKRRWVK